MINYRCCTLFVSACYGLFCLSARHYSFSLIRAQIFAAGLKKSFDAVSFVLIKRPFFPFCASHGFCTRKLSHGAACTEIFMRTITLGFIPNALKLLHNKCGKKGQQKLKIVKNALAIIIIATQRVCRFISVDFFWHFVLNENLSKC